MLGTVAKKRGRPRKYGAGQQPVPATGENWDRSGAPLRANIDPALNAALEAYIAGTMPRVTKTAAIEAGLQLLLAQAGFWPWPKPAEKGED